VIQGRIELVENESLAMSITDISQYDFEEKQGWFTKMWEL